MRNGKATESATLDLYTENISSRKIETSKGAKEVAKEAIEKCSE